MPIGFCPDETGKFSWPDSTPEATRPTFEVRFVTQREALRINRMIREAVTTNDTDEEQDRIAEALAVALVGWDKVVDGEANPIPFAIIDKTVEKAGPPDAAGKPTVVKVTRRIVDRLEDVFRTRALRVFARDFTDLIAMVDVPTKKASASPS